MTYEQWLDFFVHEFVAPSERSKARVALRAGMVALMLQTELSTLRAPKSRAVRERGGR